MAQLFNLRKNLLANPDGKLMALDARQPFTIKINTIYGTGNNTFALPLINHTTNLKIETSDGQSITITNYTDPAKLISFPSAGVYTIKIRGECGWSFNNTGDCQKVIGISKWGRLKFNYLVGAFYGCVNIGLNEGLPVNGAINAPNVSSFYKSFSTCNLTSVNNTLLHLCANAFDFQECFAANKITHIPSDFFKYTTKTQSFRQCFSTNLINTIGVGLFDNCPNANNFYATFISNKIVEIPAGLFDHCPNAISFFSCFAINTIKIIPNRLFYLTRNVTNYENVFSNAIDIGCVLPNEIFYLDSVTIGKITTFKQFFYQGTVAKSPTGTVQDIWNYASPTATKADCFQNCTGLANYASIPVDWI